MSTTPRLGLPLLDEAQDSPEIPVNLGRYAVDALLQASVIRRDLTTPPGSETEGSAFIVASPGASTWAGHTDQVAVYQGGGYRFYQPRTGWKLWVEAEGIEVIYGIGSPSTWTENSGGGGGATITVRTPGSPSTTVENVSILMFDNATVEDAGGGAALVTPTASGSSGGGGEFVWPINEPPLSPATLDDEFDDASVAAKWVWRNQNGATISEKDDWVYIEAPASASASFSIKEQTIAAGPWKIRARILPSADSISNFNYAGLVCINSSTGKFLFFGLNVTNVLLQRWDSVTAFGANVGASYQNAPVNYVPFFLEIDNDGTNVIFRISWSGLDGSWIKVGNTEAISSHVVTIDRVGFACASQNSALMRIFVDWFRRIS